VLSYLDGNEPLSQLQGVAKALNASAANAADDFLECWDRAVAKALEDGVLSTDEEERLGTGASTFGLGQAELDKRGKYTQMVKAAVLRDVLDGKVPERVKVGGIAVNLQKDEKIAWVFPGAEYRKLRTRRSYAGVSHGLSIRIAKGVYYRPSVWKASPVESSETVSGGSGNLIVTNKNLYFIGATMIRIPYKKIVAFQPHSDGIGIQRDAASAKPEAFKFGDGWFAYNLITNLAQISA
jgi:hypothetical protein